MIKCHIKIGISNLRKTRKKVKIMFFILFHQAQDCDILVHEATHEDEFAEDSDRKGHR